MTGYGAGGYGLGLYGGVTPPAVPPVGGGTAVLLDDGTGTFPHDITDKVLLGPGFAIERGRQDWQGGVTAGSLALTLDNSDGRFTVGSTVIATPSPIKVDQRIRVIETVNGTAFTRFTGYVKQWPVSWPAVVATFATVQVVATDAQARAERRALKSFMDEEYAIDSPAANYPLIESGAETSGNQMPTLVMSSTGGEPVGFGAGIGPGGGPGARFYDTTGEALWSPNSFNLTIGSVSFWIEPASPGTTYVRVPFYVNTDLGGTNFSSCVQFHWNASQVFSIWKPGTGDINLATLALNTLHHVVLTTTGSAVKVYLDGVLILNDSSFPCRITSIAIGNAPGGPATGQYTFDGSVSRVAIYNTVLSAARVSANYVAGLVAGESGTARITRVAGYAGIPLGTLDSSLTRVAYVDPGATQSSAWGALQEVADAELGIAFFDGSGNLAFHNRNRVPTKTTPDLTLSSSYITADVQATQDDQQLVNYLEVASQTTQAGQVARNTASETNHGRYGEQVTYLVETDAEALDRANWIIANFAEPFTRYGTLTINLYGMTPLQQQTVLSALEIDCWLRVTAMPVQNIGGATVDVVVEGYTEEQASDKWVITCNVVAKTLTDCLILDDPVRGVLDAGNRLYV